MSCNHSIPSLTQNDGIQIPQVGLGIYGPDDDGTTRAVVSAVQLGYRLIDTAGQYRNERGVGEGIRRSGVAREDLYVTTKLADDMHGYDSALKAFDESLDKLGVDYVDLYLIHWPQPKTNKYVETWRALEMILADGRTKSIGVSNFQPHHLNRLFNETSIVPAVNQIELHPSMQQEQMLKFNAESHILTESWSPLGRGRVFGNPVLEKIAAKHAKSVAQVVLRWHIELGAVVIPKSVTPTRLKENLNIFDFTLDPEDHAIIKTLEKGQRTGNDPDSYN